MIPIDDSALAENIIRGFRVDILLPIETDGQTERFVERFLHLRSPYWSRQVFETGHCNFVDVRHPVRRASERLAAIRSPSQRFLHPTWASDDELDTLLTAILGKYPSVQEIGIDYVTGLRASIENQELPFNPEDPLPADMHEGIVPIDLTTLEMELACPNLGWLAPGLILGKVQNFDDLILFWNLRAAGARVIFYDAAHAGRTGTYVAAFLNSVRRVMRGTPPSLNVWSRTSNFDVDLDLTGFEPSHCSGDRLEVWNGRNLRPTTNRFAGMHRSVIPSYDESETGASARFPLPSPPFDQEDVKALGQHFVVTVQARQYGARDDFTFSTPFLPSMNEFYGRNFYFIFDDARSEPGFFEGGAIGIFESVVTEQLGVRAFRVHDFLRELFDSFDIKVVRSDPPGLLSARLIRQLGGVQGCRVFKILACGL